jgi:hypothetical protein
VRKSVPQLIRPRVEILDLQQGVEIAHRTSSFASSVSSRRGHGPTHRCRT